jgi:DNA helicase HerA-like ATPase
MAAEAQPNDKIRERVERIGINDYAPQRQPVLFWDLFGDGGHPLRTTVSEMGPLLLSSVLGLNEVQEGVLYTCFKIADEQGMLLLDLKDLRAMLAWMGENASTISTTHGNVSKASLGAIQRRLLVLDEQGAEAFLGEPAVRLADLMRTDFSGNGVISVLDARRVFQKSPRVYATFLLWLLSELFEELPEVGDADRPRLAFFFDEAHLLFDRAPRALVDKVEQVARLIRSKGVGVYFVTQSPADIPDDILGQLGLRVQHALRAYTPKDQRALKVAASTFRPNPELRTEEVITQLGIGEALVSVLDEKGAPTPVERVLVRPPASRIGPLNEAERREWMSRSPLAGVYDKEVDRDSAYEKLQARAEAELQAAKAKAASKRIPEPAPGPVSGRAPLPPPSPKPAPRARGSSRRQGVGEAFVKSTVRTIGTTIGREIVRGILGSILRRR